MVLPVCRSDGDWLIELGTADAAQTVELPRGQPLVLGSGRSADVRLEDRCVSSRHCALSLTEGGVRVDDLDSTNGLYVAGARLGSALLAEDGASFVIGRTSVTLRQRSEPTASHAPRIPGLVGSSLPMRRVAEEIARHARSRQSVLLQGESGTGKDVVARALHAQSGRTGEYVPLNAGAVPDSLADAELFGHRRGAYTGAVTSRAGAFEAAHRGTLFLDEVAELSPSAQVKLLRVVEDGAVRPIGGSHSIAVDVRVVSASWASLETRVSEGRFRVDLFHRLSTITITLPPLRRRKSDIPALCRVLLERLAGDVGEKRVTSHALARLVAYAWPGNVRELSAVLYRAAMAAPGPEILVAHVVLPEPEMKGPGIVRATPNRAEALLAEHDGNVSRAARAAGVPRSTFRSWLGRARSFDQKRPATLTPPCFESSQGSTATRENGAELAVRPSSAVTK
ncbi:MAG TPA: sigma 54-interacting transcriptional regulator [Polyangiaceae bacterium]|nr:sigma 54-interacting transcriptional regulator [Polyangiaceae bacterium]